MGNDKTSWLNLDEDDDDLSGPGRDTGGFTENIPSDPGADPTFVQHGPDPASVRTEFEPGIEKTEIYHPGMAGKYSAESTFDPMTDPIVGWLVVVKGPGMGQSVNLGSGMNAIGRNATARVSLDFGDTLISGEDHLRIIYDDESRSFLVVPGTGRNVSRLNGQIIADTKPLENYARIDLSKQTQVRFVAFCNEDFDWTVATDADKG